MKTNPAIYPLIAVLLLAAIAIPYYRTPEPSEIIYTGAGYQELWRFHNDLGLSVIHRYARPNEALESSFVRYTDAGWEKIDINLHGRQTNTFYLTPEHINPMLRRVKRIQP